MAENFRRGPKLNGEREKSNGGIGNDVVFNSARFTMAVGSRLQACHRLGLLLRLYPDLGVLKALGSDEILQYKRFSGAEREDECV